MKLLFTAYASEYVLLCHDSYMIDGLTSGATVDGAGGSSALAGPLCNHPPQGMQPNVMFYPTLCDTSTMPAASSEALERIAWYDRSPLTFDGGRYQRTMVLVALRDIEDEEVPAA